ncbi:MAG: hypothetical protein CVU88_00325 [Firmicutes bacterium HGW-Firmicutes-13]|nr:MAG: hypothetical protein CVU88_00325 [Firmicutes bacterium HGW-Firmicutes-13]
MSEQNTAKDCEDLIRQVKGVLSAHVITDENGTITEIHVLSNASRSPKQIVRDIESAVLVQLGIELDHKKVSVAQLKGGEAFLPEFRLCLKGIELITMGIKAEARTTINFGEKDFTGTACGPNMVKNRLRLIATATLDTVENFLGRNVHFMVEDIQKFSFMGREVILAGISLATPRGEETLLGSAFITGDDRESVARATLDALNRRLIVLKKD